MQDFVPYSTRSPEEPASPSGPTTVSSDPLIKLERHSPSDLWCPSPSSPSSHSLPSFTHTPSFSSGHIPTSARKKRPVRPYIQPPPRVSSGRRQNSSAMSALHYGNWSSNTVKHEQSDLAHAQRRSSDDGQPPYYFTPVSDSARIRGSVLMLYQDNTARSYRPDTRQNSSGSVTPSSLTGAMGKPTLSANPSPSSDRSLHDPSQSSRVQSTSMDWHSDVPQPRNIIVTTGTPTPYYASSTTPSTHSSANPNLNYPTYNQYNTPDLYEQSGSFMSPTTYSEFTPHPGPTASTPPDIVPPSVTLPMTGPHSAPVHGSTRKGAVEEELRFLRNRVRELEIEKETANYRVRELHAALAAGYPRTGTRPSGLPSPAPNPPNMDAFQESWSARTNARIRTFCSPNRAGNALCAWHDSRRERRTYPPRMAPPGHLNCGCTSEEALFEESLARHGVGSYHPGESVRMDPTLRNPLLKLLKQRYGYKDGDFERDPVTGTWVEGEGPALWETRVLSGNSKRRSDDRKS